MSPRVLIACVVLGVSVMIPVSGRALGRCDVAPAGGDGRVDVGDALVVLRAAVGLVESTPALLAAADVAPIQPIADSFVRPVGDGRLEAVDALVCLRIAFALIRIPANLRLAIGDVEPARPAVGTAASIHVRLENDGDSDSAPGARVVVSRLGATEPDGAVVAGEAVLPDLLAPGAAASLEIPFDAGPSPGPATLRVILQPAGVDLSPDDDEGSLEIVVNGPPVADAGPDQDVVEGSVVTLAGTGSDPNGDPLLFTWSQSAGPAVPLASALPAPSFIAPDVAVETDLVFDLVVRDSDGLTSAIDAVRIRVIPKNEAPIAMATAPAVVLEGASVVLDGSASSDPDGDPLLFAWRQLDGPPVVLTDASGPIAQFLAPDAPASLTLRFELRVTDSALAEDTVEVLVRTDPDPLRPAGLRITATPNALVAGIESSALVQVEVFARDPMAEVADGTTIELDTDLGVLADAVGTTRLGRFRTRLTPGSVAGVATVRASVPGTSAEAETQVAVRSSADTVGEIVLVADPATIAAGGSSPVRLLALLTPADERNGEVPDGTLVSFEASAGSFPDGASVGAFSGVAVIPFAAPAEPGLVALTARAGPATATSILAVVDAPGDAARMSLRAGAPAAIAGGPGIPVTARLEPLVAGAPVAPRSISVTAEGGLLDGELLVERSTAPAPPDENVAPFDDFPGPGDLDRDEDGVFDPPGAREAEFVFRSSDPGLAVIRFGPAVLTIPVLDTAEEPARVTLESDIVALVPGGAPASVVVHVENAGGGPVSDGVVVVARTSDGTLVPEGDTTLSGSTAFEWTPPSIVDLAAPAWLRSRTASRSAELQLPLAPDVDTPVAIDVALEPRLLPVELADAAQLVATVRRADGTPAADGTRVVFETSGGVPAAAWAGTTGGRAEVSFSGPLAAGPLQLSARIAGTPFAARGEATAAAAGSAALLLEINDVGLVGSLTVSIALPEGVAPVPASEGVLVEIVRAAQGGVGDGFAFASFSGGAVRVALISALGFRGPGLVLRVPLTLEPGAQVDCGHFSDRIVTLATDPLAMPILGALLSCAEIVVSPALP